MEDVHTVALYLKGPEAQRLPLLKYQANHQILCQKVLVFHSSLLLHLPYCSLLDRVNNSEFQNVSPQELHQHSLNQVADSLLGSESCRVGHRVYNSQNLEIYHMYQYVQAEDTPCHGLFLYCSMFHHIVCKRPSSTC